MFLLKHFQKQKYIYTLRFVSTKTTLKEMFKKNGVEITEEDLIKIHVSRI